MRLKGRKQAPSLSRESLTLQQHRGDADIYKLLGNAVFLKNYDSVTHALKVY